MKQICLVLSSGEPKREDIFLRIKDDRNVRAVAVQKNRKLKIFYPIQKNLLFHSDKKEGERCLKSKSTLKWKFEKK